MASRPPAADPRDAQIARLQKEKAQLEQELAKARFVVDVQSKLQALLDALRGRHLTRPGPVIRRAASAASRTASPVLTPAGVSRTPRNAPEPERNLRTAHAYD